MSVLPAPASLLSVASLAEPAAHTTYLPQQSCTNAVTNSIWHMCTPIPLLSGVQLPTHAFATSCLYVGCNHDFRIGI